MNVKRNFLTLCADANRELWLILSMVSIAALCNYLIANHGMLLGFYTFPTLFSAYHYGKRHAVMTALASFLIVVLLTYFNPSILGHSYEAADLQRWCDIAVWGGSLILTAWAMGALYDRNAKRLAELRKTYHGVLMILQHFVAKDSYTQNHSYRVSIHAVRIATEMGFDEDRIEDVRAAALLHDVGKLDVSREILYKAARLNSSEMTEMRAHVERGATLLQPVGGALTRVLPIILSHHDRYDGSGYTQRSGKEIPLEARVLAVADTYDAITSDRPYRRGRTPYEAREILEKGAGTEFDPDVVAAFVRCFRNQEMEVPDVVV